MGTDTPTTTASLDMAELVAGALSLTAALAWNETAKTGIATLFPNQKGTFGATLLYAVVVTVLVIIMLAGVRTVAQTINGAKERLRANAAHRAHCRTE